MINVQQDIIYITDIYGAMNLSVVIMYSIVDSIINAFSLSLRTLDPKRNVPTIVASFWLIKNV